MTSRRRWLSSTSSGTKRRSYLEENAGAQDVELTDEDLARIEEAFPKDATAGDRYADMSSING